MGAVDRIRQLEQELEAARAELERSRWEWAQGREAVHREQEVEPAQRYRALFDSLVEGFCIVEVIFDAAGRPVDCRYLETNPAFEQQTGLKNVSGKTLRGVTPGIEQHWIDMYGRVALSGNPARAEDYAGPFHRWYRVHAFRVDNPSDRHVALLFSDTTERRQAEEALQLSEARYRSIFENAAIGVARVGLDGRYLQVNDRLCALTKHSREELLGKTFADVTHPDDVAADLENTSRLVASEIDSFSIEKRYIRGDGETIWVHVTAGIVPEVTGGEPYFVRMVQDITERKLAEESLRESEERFAATFRSSPDALIITRLKDGRIEEVNEAFVGLFGWRRDEAVGKTTLSLGIYANPEQREEGINILRREGRLRNFEGKIRRKDGKIRDMVLSAEVIRVGGEPKVLSVVEDITERKRTEEALRASEEKFARAFADNPAAITLTRMSDGRFLDVNDGFVSLSGYSREEAIGRTVDELELWPTAEDRNRFVQELHGAGRISAREQEFCRKSGEILVTQLSAQVLTVGREELILSTIVDISERKRWEEKLDEERQLLRTVIEAVPTGLIFADEAGKFRYVSPGAMQLIGGPMSGTAAGPEPGSYRMLKEDGAPFATEEMPLVQALRYGKAVPNVEITIERSDGRRLILLTNTVPTRDTGGRVTGAVVAMQDITTRKRREASTALVSEITERFATLTSADAIMAEVGAKIGQFFGAKEVAFSEMDEGGDLALVSYGWRDEDGPPLPRKFRISDIVPEEYRDAIEAAEVVAIADSETDPRVKSAACAALGVRSFVSVAHHYHGVWKSCMIMTDTSPRDWTEDEVGTFREISERIFRRLERARDEEAVRASEQALVESNKRLSEANAELEWFGRYLSHDLRAPLRTVRGFALILREDYSGKLGKSGSELVDQVVAGAEKATELIGDIQRLTGLDATEMQQEELDLREIGEDWLAHMRGRDPGKECRIRYTGDLHAHADRRLMTVALTNLFENAYKFTDGPVVEIELGRSAERRGALYVKDQGVGFDMAKARHLFMPFSRLHSQEEYAGTGLGLAIVRKVINRHGGQVWAEASSGAGATFWFTLGG